MSIEPVTSPFGEEPLVDVPLSDSPLVRVVAQVRFPRLSALAAGDELARSFAASCRDIYPILNQEQETVITITPAGVVQSPGAGHVWHLKSADERWQISFGDAFFSIDTSDYTNRPDFRRRLESAWHSFQEAFGPPFVERVGVRYINRITDTGAMDMLPRFVRSEALSGLAAPLHLAQVSHSLNDTLYQLNERRQLQAKWGILPPGAIFDQTLAPVQESSWILDIDSFEAYRSDPDSEKIGETVELLARQAYRYFRWVVTAEFLRHFGAMEDEQ